MPIRKKCKECGKEFFTKQFHIRNGNGLFCSRACSHASMRKGKTLNCFICGEKTYKNNTQIARAKSGNYFCGKSCQAIWRNREFSGEKHRLWKGGGSMYRDILSRKDPLMTCSVCKLADKRVLAAHHIDENHNNNTPENLRWLCHNCHHLTHHFPEGLKRYR